MALYPENGDPTPFRCLSCGSHKLSWSSDDELAAIVRALATEVQIEGEIIEGVELPTLTTLATFDDMTLNEITNHVIRERLVKHNGNKVRTAKSLGLNRQTLYRILSTGVVITPRRKDKIERTLSLVKG